MGTYTAGAPKQLGSFKATAGWADVFAQKKIDQAMLNNDPAAMQAAVDALKDMESKGKNRKAMLHDLGHWGGHTLGRTHLEHQMQVGLAPIAPIDGLCLSLAHA